MMEVSFKLYIRGMDASWGKFIEKFIVRVSFTVGIGDRGRDII